MYKFDGQQLNYRQVELDWCDKTQYCNNVYGLGVGNDRMKSELKLALVSSRPSQLVLTVCRLINIAWCYPSFPKSFSWFFQLTLVTKDMSAVGDIWVDKQKKTCVLHNCCGWSPPRCAFFSFSSSGLCSTNVTAYEPCRLLVWVHVCFRTTTSNSHVLGSFFWGLCSSWMSKTKNLCMMVDAVFCKFQPV